MFMFFKLSSHINCCDFWITLLWLIKRSPCVSQDHRGRLFVALKTEIADRQEMKDHQQLKYNQLN